MLTREQCRAARGLLGWTQQDLANAAGMSKTAINNFERGTHDVRSDSLQSMRRALEAANIELTGDYGVSIRRDTVQILKGQGALRDLWDDIFRTMKGTGGEILITNADERRSYEENQEPLMQHIKRLNDNNIAERLLCCEGDTFFLQPADYYRWLPKEVFQASMSSFIYGEKVALQLWEEAMILIIQSKEAHTAEKKRFEYLWQNAAIPELSSHDLQDIEKRRQGI